MSIAPHNTAPAANATGTPEPIEGAGAPKRHNGSGHASATAANPMKNPLANANDRIPALMNLTQLLRMIVDCNQT
jgi:hypothetical protein